MSNVPQQKKHPKTEQEKDQEVVTGYLKSHPKFLQNFLKNNPDLVRKMTFPSDNAKGVADFYGFRAQQLEKELHHLKKRNKLLVQTWTDNLESQKQIHQLAINILGAHSIKHLLKHLRTYLSEQMDVDYTHLCLLKGAPLPEALQQGHTSVDDATFNTLFTTSETVRLRTLYEDADKKIHGEWAAHAASDGLLKITTPSGHTLGFLALISGQRDRFHPGQGADLLVFIAQIMGHVMDGWTTLENITKCKKTG